MAARTHDVEEEHELAGRLAGVLFLSAGVTALVLLLVPGIENAHRNWVVGLAAICMAWGLFCVFLARPEKKLTGSGTPRRSHRSSSSRAWWHPRVGRALRPAFTCSCCSCTPRTSTSATTRSRKDVGRRDDDQLADVPVLDRAGVVRARLRGRGARAAALVEWLTAETERESPTGVMIVDLDGFKDVNTAHGYPAGDALLRDAAARLRGCVRTDDVVARLGGDEFAVLAPAATPHAMRLLAERTLGSLRDLRYDDVSLTASVGWVIYPDDAQSVDELIAAADFCLRGAKLTGKDRALSALDWAPDIAA